MKSFEEINTSSTEQPTRKKCESLGCTRVAQRGGKCITHGVKRIAIAVGGEYLGESHGAKRKEKRNCRKPAPLSSELKPVAKVKNVSDPSLIKRFEKKAIKKQENIDKKAREQRDKEEAARYIKRN